MAKTFNVVVTRRIPDAGIALLKKKKNFQVRVSSFNGVLPRPQLLRMTKGADAVLSLLTDRIDEKFFAAAGPQLKIVANYAVGFDNIDLAAAKKHGVAVTNTPGVLDGSVAEHTVTLMFALAKHICEADRFTRAGRYKGWEPMLFLGTTLHDKTVGIIGLGRIGMEVAQRVKALGMQVLYTDLKRDNNFEKKFDARYLTREALLKKADFVTLHVPLLKSTVHLIGAKELKLMKKTAFLVNTARGPVVDEKALARALSKKHIAGAALDVFECEPSIDCDPSDHLELKNLDNIIMTPHIASATIEARNAMAELAAKNIIAVLGGKKPLTPAR